MAETKRGPGRPPGSKNKNTKTKESPKKASKETKEKEAQVRAKTGSRVRDEIWAIILIAIGVFLVIALQTDTAGEFGHILSDFLKGCFGIIALGLPYYLILYGLLLFAKRTVHITGRSVFFLFIIFLMACIMNASRFIQEDGLDLWPMAFMEFFHHGITLEGGGLVGTVLAQLLIKAFGMVGLWIFSIVIIIICLLLVINTPVSQFIETLAEKRARKKADLVHETSWEKQEEEEEKIVVVPEPKDFTPSSTKNSAQQAMIKTLPEAEEENFYQPGKMSEGQLKILRLMNDDSLFEPSNETPSGMGLEGTMPISTGYGLSGDPMKPKETESVHPRKETDKDTFPVLTEKNTEPPSSGYEFPPLHLLLENKSKGNPVDSKALRNKAEKLEETLRNFNVGAKVLQVTQGPTVTRYEIQPDIGVKVNSITRLADDIALNLEAKSIRIEAPIPGKAAVGIEVENEKVNLVPIREMIQSKEFAGMKSKIAFAIGKDLSGTPIVADLKEMPHLLIAGSTGSGKSVCINSILTSLLYRAKPDEVKLILIDPKVVELGSYNGIPHLLIPVVTDPKKAAAALNWAVTEMTDRYKRFAEASVRDLEHYNDRMNQKGAQGQPLPQIVIVIDELADLMMAAPNQVEESICRLAQMARAAGMHLIVATQRPSVDIITGVIKANIPSRIAFAVSSQFDSRTILDMSGAEKLVGKGDMLFSPQSLNKPIRLQGSYITDGEVAKVIEFVKSQNTEVDYQDHIIKTIEKNGDKETSEDHDDLLEEAIETVVRAGQASVSMLQRRFRIGYNRAARMIDLMESRHIIGPADGSRPRQVLWTEVDFYAMKGLEGEDYTEE
jgi:S-DNA-T family DNA segregation ATPase FtsK/SpoIIIE